MIDSIIIIFCFLLVIHPISCQLIQERYDATSIIKDNILYVLGGQNDKAIPEILSLNLTTSIAIDSPPWSRSLKAPPLAFVSSGAILGGLNNNLIYVLCGLMSDPVSGVNITNEQTLLEYDIQKDEWNATAMSGAPQLNGRVKFGLLSDNKGMAYLHGGYNYYNYTYLGDTYLFDNYFNSWTALPVPIIPIIADDFAAVLLNDGRLVIIGGYENNVPTHRPISQLEILNTIDDNWSRQIVLQPKEMTDHRRYHTSTLLPNGDIVIIGGVNVVPNVVILETTKNQWRIPLVSGMEPPLLNRHCAELVENRYIFIMFGIRTDGQYSNKLFILDTTNYSWITNFTPNALSASTPKPTLSPSHTQSTVSGSIKALNISITVIIIIVALVFSIALIGSFVFCYKKRKNRLASVTTQAENYSMSKNDDSHGNNTNIIVYSNEGSHNTIDRMFRIFRRSSKS
ncbi:14844_t:CDS:2 [Funneliformis geosporum]|uniref:18121_t:CDS:1 n=1 Tax=Funneliformis geosporum TaxID=1117311 RepID=A0A9W4SXS2_9GLOM|nr:18121_t:CDS:2 [Funneliformis geosporum]CAI2187665.1 14844_t:CDS:2 [Funneliformis geosporum]